MINIKSKLENNLFDNILLKKGFNSLSEKAYNKLKKNKVFINFCNLGYIACSVKEKVKELKEDLNNKPDFEKMSYNDLKKYVKENNIVVDSLKKEDILKALIK